MSDASRYTRKHIMLHWGIAVVVVLQFAFAPLMKEAFLIRVESINAGWTEGAIAHAVFGAGIGVAMVWRLMIRLTTALPPPPRAPRAAGVLRRVTHLGFYAVLIAMPIVGALAWFSASDSIAQWHGAAAQVLVGLVVLHLAGSAYHHLIQRDRSVIRRMIPR